MIVITVARKPLGAGNVASNVLLHGCGAININATRISLSSDENPEALQARSSGDRGFRKDGYVGGIADGGLPPGWDCSKGRWPANLVLSHTPGCTQDGTRKVPDHKGYPNGPGGKSTPMHGWGDKRSEDVRPNAWQGHADSDGTETVAVWNCTVDCPVAGLDAESGTQKSGTAVRHRGVETGGYGGNLGKLAEGTPDLGYGDTGGASRFFKQVGGSRESS